MRTRSMYTAVAVLIAFGFLMARGYGGGRRRLAEGMERARQTRLEQAWLMLESNLEATYDAGYANFTASQMAEHIATTASTSQTLTEQEMKRYRDERVPIPRPIKHVVGKPTATWQIVLVPNDSARVINVEMYGTDLKVPIKTKELRLGM